MRARVRASVTCCTLRHFARCDEKKYGRSERGLVGYHRVGRQSSLDSEGRVKNTSSQREENNAGTIKKLLSRASARFITTIAVGNGALNLE